jgi:hypothetical protein
MTMNRKVSTKSKNLRKEKPVSMLNQEKLKEVAEVAEFLMTIKDTPEMQILFKAVFELAGEIKPIVQSVSRFITQTHIDAIKQMEEAGLSREQAIALRIHDNQAITQSLNRGLKNLAKKSN